MLQAEQFWQYSLGVYGLEAIKQQCLSLQNNYGLNVNMVLLCGFLTHHKMFVNAGLLKTLHKKIQQTDQQLKILRTKRNAHKSHAQKLYRSLLEQELILEKRQQKELILELNNLSNNHTEFYDQKNDNFISYYQSLETADEQILIDIMCTKALILNASTRNE